MRNRVMLVLMIGLLMAMVVTFFATTVVAQQAFTRWEYLTVDYSQIGGAMFEGNPLEFAIADAEPYASTFSSIMLAGCEEIPNDDYETELECQQSNFKGRAYFLNVLGDDGWELIQVDNQSTQTSYKVDMLFKRPKP